MRVDVYDDRFHIPAEHVEEARRAYLQIVFIEVGSPLTPQEHCAALDAFDVNTPWRQAAYEIRKARANG